MRCRPAVGAVLAGLLAAPVEAGIIGDSCFAGGLGSADTCACMQDVADRYLGEDEQTLYMAYVLGQVTLLQLIRVRGEAEAHALFERMSEFSEDSQAECGVP